MISYFDYNATAPLCLSSQQAIQSIMGMCGNPSSVHTYGRRVRKEIEKARDIIAEILGIESKRIIFTSGATEANNIALKHFPGQVFVSAIEHDCVYNVREDANVIPVNESGVVCLDKLKELLELNKSHDPILISVMLANNETGVIQPLQEIVSLAKQYGAYVHSDIVQALGRIDFPWHILDMASISSHKLGGPAGCGCLIVNSRLAVKPLLVGGGQEKSYRPGTENSLGIVGMAAALQESIRRDWGQTRHLRDFLENSIVSIYGEASVVPNICRLPNTTMLWMPGVKNETQVISFDLLGFAVSAGSACSSGKIRSSRVLQSMGLPKEKAQETIRVSLGPDVELKDVQSFIQAWQTIYTKNLQKGVKSELRTPEKSNLEGNGNELYCA